MLLMTNVTRVACSSHTGIAHWVTLTLAIDTSPYDTLTQKSTYGGWFSSHDREEGAKRIPMGKTGGAQALSRMPEHFVGGNNFDVTIVTKRLGETCYYIALLLFVLFLFWKHYFLETLFLFSAVGGEKGTYWFHHFFKNCEFHCHEWISIMES